MSKRDPAAARAIDGQDQRQDADDHTRELAVEYRKLDDLVPYARNARTHSEAQVAETPTLSRRL